MEQLELTLDDLRMGYPELIREAEEEGYRRGLRDGETKARGELNRQARASAFLEKSGALNRSPGGSAWEQEGFLSEEAYLAFKKAEANNQIRIFSKPKEGR